MALPFAQSPAQGLEAESLAGEFSLAEFVDEEIDEAEYAVAEQCDVGEPELMVVVTDQVTKQGRGFRRFQRVVAGGSFVERGEQFNDNEILNGFGSADVNFETPGLSYLSGFRDYGVSADIDIDDVDEDNLQFPIEQVTVGPGGVIGRDFDVDNSDGDFAGGVIGLVTVTPSGDPLVYFYYDFDDLHEFNIRFDELNVVQRQYVNSVELMAQHLWDWERGILTRRPAWRAGMFSPYVAAELGSLPVADMAGPTSYQHRKGDGLLAYLFSGYKTANYLAYGLRGNRGRDEFYWGGDIGGNNGWGNTFADTRTTNYLVGPQVSLGRVAERGPWRLDLSGHVTLGYSRIRTKQAGGFGQNIVTGGFNNSSVAQPTFSNARNVTESFGQHAELRLTSSYHVRTHWTVDLTLRGFATGPWHESSDLVVYRLPNLGLREPKDKYLLGGNLFLGMTYLR